MPGRSRFLSRIVGLRCLLALSLLPTVLPSPEASAEGPQQAVPADPDFQIQGDYLGEIVQSGGKTKMGVQVIALGKEKFRAVGYLGGIPGDGWDGADPREFDGQTENGVATFENGGERLTIEGGTVIVKAKGAEIGKLPKVVRGSTTLEAEPPQGAVILFDGKNADQFEGGHMTDDGLLMPGATSKPKFQSGLLHIEFRIPFGPLEPSRGNSGCYLQNRYEVQILDSFGLKPHNHECGGIPSVKAPDVNMSYPPLAWQTYDVEFTAAQYREGRKMKNARMTVRHNGVVVHDDVEVPHVTTSAPLEEGPEPGPIYLQEHGGQVRFRNIWFLPRAE